MTKLLEVESITKSFGGLFALLNVSLHVNEGETLGLIGPNGSGKTTLFNIIMRELKQDSGGIYFEGEEISKYPTHKRVKMGIARTYQIPRPFSEMNVTDNIRVGIVPDSIAGTMNTRGYSEQERQI